MAKAGRRSAKDWARLIREWKRSGQTAGQFASTYGLRPQTLMWWRWRLRGSVRKPTTAAAARSVQLVRVQVEESGGAPGAAKTESDVAWELLAPSGHVLRVYGREAQLLGEALAAIMGRGGRA
jgi:transposase